MTLKTQCQMTLGRLAFARALKANTTTTTLDAMKIPITLRTAQKETNHVAFLDCGATECFISQQFINQHQLGVKFMNTPTKLENTDGSPNAGGGLKYFTELEVVTGETPNLLHFYITDMGPNDLVLGYPWFVATNPHPNWKTGTLPTPIVIRTTGVASGKPMRSARLAGTRTTIPNQPEPEETLCRHMTNPNYCKTVENLHRPKAGKIHHLACHPAPVYPEVWGPTRRIPTRGAITCGCLGIQFPTSPTSTNNDGPTSEARSSSDLARG